MNAGVLVTPIDELSPSKLEVLLSIEDSVLLMVKLPKNV